MKIQNYELQRGDWLKLNGYPWMELLKTNEGLTTYYFSGLTHCDPEGLVVEAVLRPSIVIRDELDEHLRVLRLPQRDEKSTHEGIEFTLIHPKQEAQNDVLPLIKDLEDLAEKFKALIEKCDYLKNKLASNTKS